MIPYVVYDDTGKIVKSGVCSNTELKIQATKPGQHAIRVSKMRRDYDVTHEIKGNAISKKSKKAQ